MDSLLSRYNTHITPTLHDNPPSLGTSTTTKVALIGDSTFDNEFWVGTNHKQSVPGQLEALGYNVTNLAIDGFTTDRVLNGGPGCAHRADNANNPYAQKSPLSDLKGKKFTHVVLSVGGNDIREKLHSPNEFAKIGVKIQRNYLEILDQIKRIDQNIRPIIMLQYCLDITNDHYGVYKAMQQLNPHAKPDLVLHDFMKEVYKPILLEAQKRKIPVIDMANTFNYRDTSLYISQIEPSKKGGNVIVRMIDHVILRHNFNGDSMCYQGNSNAPSLNITSKCLDPLAWQVIPVSK